MGPRDHHPGLWAIEINGVVVGFGASFEETPEWWAPYHEPISEAEPHLGFIREQYVDNGRHMVRRIPIVNG